jgi:hypothetical protein
MTRVIYSNDMERELRDGEWGRMLLKNIEKNGPPSSLGIRSVPPISLTQPAPLRHPVCAGPSCMESFVMPIPEAFTPWPASSSPRMAACCTVASRTRLRMVEYPAGPFPLHCQRLEARSKRSTGRRYLRTLHQRPSSLRFQIRAALSRSGHVPLSLPFSPPPTSHSST